MHIESILKSDLSDLINLQPPDWSDILPDFNFYLNSGFCYPVKAVVNNIMAGIGTAVIFNQTAWLAHIIVHPDYRNQGIGYRIVNELLKIIDSKQVATVLLTATELGNPVYKKAGFTEISEYVFMSSENSLQDDASSDLIINYSHDYKDQLLELDHKASGEDRQNLILRYCKSAQLYIQNDSLAGFFIPDLKERPVIASHTNAGIALLKLRCKNPGRIVIPAQNSEAINYLIGCGYTVLPNKGTRMSRGREVEWNPGMIYGRIGGNFG